MRSDSPPNELPARWLDRQADGTISEDHGTRGGMKTIVCGVDVSPGVARRRVGCVARPSSPSSPLCPCSFAPLQLAAKPQLSTQGGFS
jgi:hypothetical protein